MEIVVSNNIVLANYSAGSLPYSIYLKYLVEKKGCNQAEMESYVATLKEMQKLENKLDETKVEKQLAKNQIPTKFLQTLLIQSAENDNIVIVWEVRS